jgi:hypothetical protein
VLFSQQSNTRKIEAGTEYSEVVNATSFLFIRGDDVAKGGLAVEISVKDIDLFHKVIDTLKEVVEDERIPENVRKEYKDKVLKLSNGEHT